MVPLFNATLSKTSATIYDKITATSHEQKRDKIIVEK